MQPYLWWKKYLTQLQLLQFIVVFIHSLIPLFTDCDYPTVRIFLLCSLFTRQFSF
jgi:elongation of very long chain fatty acids protein 4